jgi:hypothetical protein
MLIHRCVYLFWITTIHYLQLICTVVLFYEEVAFVDKLPTVSAT